jgi:hypothetical protein
MTARRARERCARGLVNIFCSGWPITGDLKHDRQAVDFLQFCFSNSVGKIHLKKTSGVSKPEISSDFAIAALLIQLKAGAIFARLSCIDPQGAAAYFLAVELLDSRHAFFARRHFDEAEAARATCFTIFNQGYAFDSARLGEQCS